MRNLDSDEYDHEDKEENLGCLFFNIEKRMKEFESEHNAILDLSVFPDLKKIIEQKRINLAMTYYIPDTIQRLLKRAKKDSQYYYLTTRLLGEWTRRTIDLKFLSEVLVREKNIEINIEFITEEMVDKKTFLFCHENFSIKSLTTEFSPRYNLLGDIVGKTLGFARKSGYPILMLNGKLVRIIRGKIPIFDAATMFVDRKQDFFRKSIPYYDRSRGARWLVGTTVGITISPIGFILAVIDP